MDNLFPIFQDILINEVGNETVLLSSNPVGGGCINNGTRLTTEKGSFFLKWNRGLNARMFEKEVAGLSEIRKQNIFAVPEPVGFGTIKGLNYLLLENLEAGPTHPKYWSDFGNRLAGLHGITLDCFGFREDNFIGRLPQVNGWNNDWIEFFINNRLEPQLELARDNGLVPVDLIQKFDSLCAKLPELLVYHAPSLIHGDLWSGNCITGPNGKVCLIDPAVYYANREIEIAFTRLFGGFTEEFYEQYFEQLPVPPGFDERVGIYNLYPLLVHVNLFGTSYLAGISSTLKYFVG